MFMEENPVSPVVQKFAQECVEAGLKPEDVVAAAGVHRSHWPRWKTGTFAPSMKNWAKISDALERLKLTKAA